MQDGDDWIEENIWECNSCNQENLGRYMKCQRCGSPKEFDEQDKPITSIAANPVTDAQQLADANAGVNWQCEYCMCQVRNSKGECQNCAAKRDQFNSVVTPSANLDEQISAAEEVNRIYRKDLEKRKDRERARIDRKMRLTIGGVFVGLVALILLVAFLWPNKIVGKVASTRWEYTLVVHTRQVQHSSGWGSPSDAFNTQCETRFKENVACHPHDCNPHDHSFRCHSETYKCNPHPESHPCRCHSEKYGCHKECESLKNGYSKCHNECSSREVCDRCSETVYDICERHDTCHETVYDICYDRCPVYDNWCEYDHYIWPETARLKTEGINWTDAKFQDFMELPTEAYRYDKLEEYTVIFRANDPKDTTVYIYHPKTMDVFRQYGLSGMNYVLTKDFFGGTVTPEMEKL